MTHTAKTFILLFVVLLLIGATIYVSIMFKEETESVPPTTIQKNKPAARTYSKTLSLNLPSPTVAVSPEVSPADSEDKESESSESFAAIQNPAVTTSPTPTTPFFASSVKAADTSITPTETILAQAESAATVSATIQPTKTIMASLPDAGWMRPSHLFFIFAFTLIFFSLLY